MKVHSNDTVYVPLQLVLDCQRMKYSLPVYCALASLMDSRRGACASLESLMTMLHVKARRDRGTADVITAIAWLKQEGYLVSAPDYLHMKQRRVSKEYDYQLAPCCKTEFVRGQHYAIVKREELKAIFDMESKEGVSVSSEKVLFILCWIRSGIYLKNNKGRPMVLATSMEQISEDTGINERTVRRTIGLLKDLNLIVNKKIVNRFGDQTVCLSLYTFPWGKPEAEIQRAATQYKESGPMYFEYKEF